VSYICS